MSDDNAKQVAAEPDMAQRGAPARDVAGRFQAGASGNPGGRPSRDVVVRRLAGRRASEAVALLCEMLAGDAAVIVVDARQVLEDLVARAARLRPDLAPSLAEFGGLAPALPPSPAEAWRDRYGDILEELEGEWDQEIVGTGVDAVWNMRHRTTGEVLGYWAFGERCEAAAVARMVAEGFPAEEPEEPSVFAEHEAEDC